MNYPIVEVEWLDASSTEEVDKEDLKEMKTVTFKTVGYLIEDNKRYIKTCVGMSTDGVYHDVWVIPKGWNTKIRRLK